LILQDLLYKVSIRSVKGNTNIEIKDLVIDSRNVKPGACFIALKGTATDGQAFIGSAIEKGAVAIVCETLPDTVNDTITYIQVENCAAAAGYLSHNFYGEPSLKIKLVGVTGTNGKTTIATLLWKLFNALGHKCGLISTVQNQVGDRIVAATHTTPDAVHINALLKQMADEGCTYVFMECSSHAIHQERITGLQFTGALHYLIRVQYFFKGMHVLFKSYLVKLQVHFIILLDGPAITDEHIIALLLRQQSRAYAAFTRSQYSQSFLH